MIEMLFLDTILVSNDYLSKIPLIEIIFVIIMTLKQIMSCLMMLTTIEIPFHDQYTVHHLQIIQNPLIAF